MTSFTSILIWIEPALDPTLWVWGKGKVRGRAKLQIDKGSICKFGYKYYVIWTWIQ